MKKFRENNIYYRIKEDVEINIWEAVAARFKRGGIYAIEEAHVICPSFVEMIDHGPPSAQVIIDQLKEDLEV